MSPSRDGRVVEPRAVAVEAGRLTSRSVDDREIQKCEACGTRMYGLHCKIVCPNCGYKRDCSDP